MSKPGNPFLKKATGAGKAPASVDAKRKHGLGRGLDGLLSSSLPPPAVAPVRVESRPVAQQGAPLELNILDIERSPYQPRRDFKEEELKELAESLKNSGLVQPPTVRKNAAGRYLKMGSLYMPFGKEEGGWRQGELVVRVPADAVELQFTLGVWLAPGEKAWFDSIGVFPLGR